MRLNLVIRSAVSGLAVYVLAAACSASERATSSRLADGGEGTDGATSIGDAIADVFADVVDPVKDARAAEPDVATEPCNKPLSNGGVTAYVAEHAYPGKTASELALVHALIGGRTLAGYPQQTALPFVKDGSVAVICATGSQPDFGVTFVLPQ